MSMFHLKNHRVKAASFLENMGRKNADSQNIGLEGSMMIPQNEDQGKDIAIRLKLSLGGKEDRMLFNLETITVFEVLENKEAVNEQTVRQECFPAAMAKLRETVRQVSMAYGMPPLELPPFQGEVTT